MFNGPDLTLDNIKWNFQQRESSHKYCTKEIKSQWILNFCWEFFLVHHYVEIESSAHYGIRESGSHFVSLLFQKLCVCVWTVKLLVVSLPIISFSLRV